MQQLALELPGFSGRIQGNPAINYVPAGFAIADVINDVAEISIYIGGALMFFWALWGVFDYIRAEGNKEALAKARKKIQWAIVGFVILILAFFVSDLLIPIVARSGIGNRSIDSLSY